MTRTACAAAPVAAVAAPIAIAQTHDQSGAIDSERSQSQTSQWLSFLSAHPLQAKLAIGAVNDPLEREADAAADRVMRMANPAISLASVPPQLSRKCLNCEEEGESVQRKASGAEMAGDGAPAMVDRVLASPGRAFDPAINSFMSSRFGTDFSSVRIHVDTQAAQSAAAVGARAYTVGRDVVFGAGQYDPAGRAGRHLIAHELAHVVQQEGETVLRRAPRRRGRGTGRPPQICGRASRRVAGNWITQVNLDVGANNLTIVWNDPATAPSNSTGPFNISPGAGLCCVDCNDPATSQRSGSLCTPKGGSWPVDGVGCALGGHPTARNPTRFQRSGIAIHSGNVSSPPQSHGCSRTSLRASELIHDNVRVGQTMISSSGTWAGSQCYQTEGSDALVSRATVCRASTPSRRRRARGGGGAGGTSAPTQTPAAEPTPDASASVPVAQVDLHDGPGPNNEPAELGPEFGDFEVDTLATEEDDDDSAPA